MDLRDPVRSGIARVARSLAEGLARRLDADTPQRFSLTLAGPAPELRRIGVHEWSRTPIAVRDWSSGRHSLTAHVQWLRASRGIRNLTWFFPHWDVPWFALPPRYVAMVHDLTLIRVPGATSAERRHLAAGWIRHTVRHAAAIVVPSRYTASDLSAFLPEFESKIRVLPEGVDARFFEPPPPLPEPLAVFAAGGPFMLSVGNRKRHKNLVQGVELLQRIPDLRWVVVGEWFPPWEEVAVRAAAAGIADRMMVLEPVSDDALRALYHAAACLFFPSRREGFGLPLAEAIGCGLPVVCSGTSSLPEVAGACATYCDPDDTDGFESAVRNILTKPYRQPAPCIDRIRGMTWDASADRLFQILEEIS